MKLKEQESETDHLEKSWCVYLSPSDQHDNWNTTVPTPLIQGAIKRTRRGCLGPVTAPYLLGNNHGAKWWLDGERGKESREWWERDRKKETGGGGGREGDQFSTPVSIMSLPVSTDSRIKLLRDLPELQYDQYSGNVYPDLTDVCHGVTSNMTRPVSQKNRFQTLLSRQLFQLPFKVFWCTLVSSTVIIQACETPAS